MTDRYTFQHGPLEVRAEDNYGYDDGIGVYLNLKEIYRASVVDDPTAEAADLFKAFKTVYEVGEAKS